MRVYQEYVSLFEAAIRERGETYHRERRVTILDNDRDYVEAEVVGTEIYRSSVEVKEDGTLHLTCNCEYFEQHGPCKHLWATVLEASHRHVLPRPPGERTDTTVELDDTSVRKPRFGDLDDTDGSFDSSADDDQEGPPDSAGDSDGESSDDFDDDGLADPRGAQARPQLRAALGSAEAQQLLRLLTNGTGSLLPQRNSAADRRSRRSRSKAEPLETAWRTQLSQLSESMRGATQPPPRALAWPTGRRLIYVVDVEATNDRGLVLRLMQESPRRDGGYERPKPVRLTQSQIQQLPDATDRQILQGLIGIGRQDFDQFVRSGLGEEFAVDTWAYRELLKTVCQTGRCRTLSPDNQFEMLQWDGDSSWEFCLELKPSPGGRYLNLDGTLRRATLPTAVPAIAAPAIAAPAIAAPAIAAPVIASAATNAEMPSVAETTAESESAVTSGEAGEDVEKASVEAAGVPTTEGRSLEAMQAEAATAEDDETYLSSEVAASGLAPDAVDGAVTDGESAAGEAVAEMQNGEERTPLGEALLLMAGEGGDGFVFMHGKVSTLVHHDAFAIIEALRDGEKISVPLDKQGEMLKMLLKFPRLPRLELPPELAITQLSPAPKPHIKVQGGRKGSRRDNLVCTVSFDYGRAKLEFEDPRGAVLIDDGQTLVRRDSTREGQFIAELSDAGIKTESNYWGDVQSFSLPVSRLPKAVGELTRRGWTVEAEGKLYRSAGQVSINVSSGIDWFELHGQVSFDGITASLPRLLEALRKGESVVKLDDGTFGLLPEEWLKKYAGVAGMGESDGDAIKFSSRQIGFLDALLSALPDARFDDTFSRARDELMRFGGVEAVDPPTTFIGVLRQYQREGLGWMAFLRKFGFGGVLADDMGLGKTVQVLALLEARRPAGVRRAEAGSNAPAGSSNGSGHPPETRSESANGREALHVAEPAVAATNGSELGVSNSTAAATADVAAGVSLVVAPRSLIFNWKSEAEKFAPGLRVLDHTAVDRKRSADHFADYDLILTTYGTLRRDMSYFKDLVFDYAILDEAQAIKNGSSESAKAARLIRANHRLALSGTPVQNHLGELWSLFDYLNPGMMGNVGVLRDLSADAANKDATARELLARSLRPFILRRTKEQVAKDLPQKQEQTIFCELEKDQRKLYDELRDHYRTSLLERVARDGMNKAKIMVLEALLRLRQAACHPGLIDKTRSGEASAKLETLMERLNELVDEGHKVLVFSQFTSLLAIVRQRLDSQNVVYEYLDGRTKDRQARVDRFQSDPDCKLFLISLKAGGVGLNLTAAEYVFLLDPWWNPAVEAQAIDRAHRIGQTRRVFAYRLIAKETVEEKVLQLQQSKKDLADAIINADNSLIRSLSRDDLEMLLS